MTKLEAHDRADTFVPHRFEEHLADLGEIRMNYAVAGSRGLPALLLIPGQCESWWGYEDALPLLAEHFQAFAVDLRGQGRSTWTPGRYLIETMGNDLVRFIDLVIGRPVIVSGLSSGGVLSAWLSAYAKPEQIRGAVYEDPPLFASEVNPARGQNMRQGLGPWFGLMSKWLGDQWSIGDWTGMQAAASRELPEWLPRAMAALAGGRPQRTAEASGRAPDPNEVPQNLKEYDPEWARAFASGAVMAGCDHELMLSQVRVPVLFTHHFRQLDEKSGVILGAISDFQVERVRELVTGAGQRFDYRSFPEMPHAMHREDPQLFTNTLLEWASRLD